MELNGHKWVQKQSSLGPVEVGKDAIVNNNLAVGLAVDGLDPCHTYSLDVVAAAAVLENRVSCHGDNATPCLRGGRVGHSSRSRGPVVVVDLDASVECNYYRHRVSFFFCLSVNLNQFDDQVYRKRISFADRWRSRLETIQ